MPRRTKEQAERDREEIVEVLRQHGETSTEDVVRYVMGLGQGENWWPYQQRVYGDLRRLVKTGVVSSNYRNGFTVWYLGGDEIADMEDLRDTWCQQQKWELDVANSDA